MGNRPKRPHAVGVVPCADPVGMATRVGARHDPYGMTGVILVLVGIWLQKIRERAARLLCA